MKSPFDIWMSMKNKQQEVRTEAALQAAINADAPKTYYTLEVDGELLDLEMHTAADVVAWAEEWWDEKCGDFDVPGRRDGSEVEAFVVGFYFEEHGDHLYKVQVSSQKITLHYEYGPSDREEHGVYPI